MQKEKLAIILSRFPYPLDKGDKLRAFYQIKYLSQDYEISLFALSSKPVADEWIEQLHPYCAHIHIYYIHPFSIGTGIVKSLLSGLPIQVGYFYSSKIKKEIHKNIEKRNIKKVYCQLSRTALYANEIDCFKVIDFQDAFSINYLRQSQNTQFIHKLFFLREHKTMKKFEEKMFSQFNYSTIITEFDKEQLVKQNPKMKVIQNGVDTDFFNPKKKSNVFDIAFVGNLSYLPNKQAVLYIVKKIYPILKEKLPSIQINIAGADTPQEFYQFSDENICISGFVDDIRDVYLSTKIMIAPLFTGAGLQNKILEAMSMELPCITSEIVCHSLDAEHQSNLYVASTPEEFANYTLQLLQDDELRIKTGKQARKFVLEHFSWKKANKNLSALLSLNK